MTAPVPQSQPKIPATRRDNIIGTLAAILETGAFVGLGLLIFYMLMKGSTR